MAVTSVINFVKSHTNNLNVHSFLNPMPYHRAHADCQPCRPKKQAPKVPASYAHY